MGLHGMVAASQPLAAQIGVQVLAAGGGAADAAVATAAALNVTEPTSTGIGGDCFALYFDASSRTVTALNGSGRAPAKLSLDLLEQRGFRAALPPFHAFTVTVPGACAAWCDLVERHGRLPLGEVLEPAAALAERGFPVAPITAHFWEVGARRQLATAPGGQELTLAGRAPRPGEIFRNPGLARTLRTVAAGGAAAFYKGEIGRAIAQAVQTAGGVLAESDLAAHRSRWETPISTIYRGTRIWECGPNSQGLAALLALNILEGFELAGLEPLGERRLHWVLEALRLAFADAGWYVADPDSSPAPLRELLSKEYAAERRALIHPGRANHEHAHGAIPTHPDTVYLSAVDGQGNACSLINSNYMGFGTGIVPSGWGFSLQNRGLGFSLDPGHPNALAPGKRPYHTIIPALATREDDSLLACFGVMGGYMQPQGHVQVLLGLLEDRLDPQAALDRPRVCLLDGSPGSEVGLEHGIAEETAAALRAKGHRVSFLSGHDRAVFGRGQVILREPATGVLWGGSDPRADGCAVAVP
jgi:gamma-glutamyltranspeptidase/glutathione hydrolase